MPICSRIARASCDLSLGEQNRPPFPTVPGVIRGNIHVVLRPLRVSGEIVSAHAERDHYPEPPALSDLTPTLRVWCIGT